MNKHLATAGLLITGALSLTACGGNATDTASSAVNSAMSSTSAASPSMSSPMSSSSMSSPMSSSSSMDSSSMSSSSMGSSSGSSSSMGSAAAAGMPFGPGCSAVPASGKGSFSGMTSDPVATAASHNPVLSTLTTAVGKAGLVDTLNTSKDITVFALANSAFAKLPKDQLDKTLADKTALTKLLTGHVVKGRLTPAQLAGEHTSLAGTKIKVTGSGEKFMVDDNASVVCGNVQTANATVYIVDSVLMGK